MRSDVRRRLRKGKQLHIEERVCLRDGYTIDQTGCTTYEFKQRLGSALHTVFLFFRHRNPMLNWALRKLMAIFSVKPEQLARMETAE